MAKMMQLITGFAPIKLPQLDEMGIPVGPISLISKMAGKSTLQFSIPTVAPAVLAAFLDSHGVEVEVIDYFIDSKTKFDADIVGISSTFLGLEDVKNIARKIRLDNPDAKIVLGGPLSWSVNPSMIMQQVSELDYIIMREGEQTILDLVNAITKAGDPGKIPGLLYKKGDKLLQTQLREPINCQSITRPNWKIAGIPSKKRLPVLPVETSRGCPFNCAYCSEVSYWGKPVRYRKIEDVADEIEDNVSSLGIKTFRFTDSCFSAPPERCGQLCDLLYQRCISNGAEIRWSSYARISNLDYPLLEKMKHSGCVALDIGLESGSNEMLRSMGRNYAPEKAISIAEYARDLGIITNFNIVIGFPGETAESIAKTSALIESAKPDTFAAFLFYLAPNTRVDFLHEQFHVRGRGLEWTHDTMSSGEAKAIMGDMGKNITASADFPGGEYFACYLSSIGYEVPEIKLFYSDINGAIKGTAGPKSLERISNVVSSASRYW
jgi:radical SAM superfamily enzyme YgiQ (UPF0313 family)